MTPCSTLEQRWSACRNAYQPWVRWAAGLDTCLVWWGPPQRDISHRRPCTSPRRHQCRAGLSMADDGDLRVIHYERAHGRLFPWIPVFIDCRDSGWR